MEAGRHPAMSFRPYPTRSGFITLAVTVISGATTILLINQLLQQNDPLQIFKYLIWMLVALGITGVALYLSLVAFRLDYHLSRNGVTIQWGLGQQRIPIEAIEKIIFGQQINTLPNFSSVNLGGLRLGWGESSDYGPLKLRTTAPTDHSLLIVTPNVSYLISPHQPQAFIKAWQIRRELGPTQHWNAQTRRQWPFNLPQFTDPLTWWLLAIAAALCFVLFGYIALQYANLPQALPVHFNNLGRADRIANKVTLFVFPAAGTLVWLVNGVLGILFYRREKVAAYFLWGSSIAMQLCLWLATLTIASA